MPTSIVLVIDRCPSGLDLSLVRQWLEDWALRAPQFQHPTVFVSGHLAN